MQISPEHELVFQKSTLQNPKQTLSIKNTFQDYLAFKVKTTAPKHFVVRPNAGRLSPGESVEISIVFQVRGDPDTNRKDKFLVQSIKVPQQYQTLDDKSFNDKIGELWNQAEMIKKNSPDSDVLIEKKLRCLYSVTDQSSPLPQTTRARADTSRSVEEFDESQPQYAAATVGKDEASSSQKVTVASTATPPIGPTTTADKSLQKELKDLKEKNALLTSANEGYKKELERVNNLRQRKAETTTPPTSSHIAPTQKSGKTSNLQYVAILCMVFFLLGAWLF